MSGCKNRFFHPISLGKKIYWVGGKKSENGSPEKESKVEIQQL